MYRSASANRVSDAYFNHASSSPPAKKASEVMALPLYDPAISETVKKERSKMKTAENAVHVIPLVLLLCVLILWLFSNPELNFGSKTSEAIAARIEGLTIEGDTENDSDATQTGYIGTLDNLDSAQANAQKSSKIK